MELIRIGPNVFNLANVTQIKTKYDAENQINYMQVMFIGGGAAELTGDEMKAMTEYLGNDLVSTLIPYRPSAE
jgi:hypothetical protein